MKSLKFTFAAIFICANIIIFYGQTSIKISGIIDSDTVWDADTVKVIGDVIINPDIRLTILPGTYVEFQDYYGITCSDGIIDAAGTNEEKITFTIKDTLGFYGEPKSNKGGWKGIKIIGKYQDVNTSKFQYCDFKYGKKFDPQCNYQTNGGALFVTDYNTIIVENCNFISNSVSCPAANDSQSKGGAIYCILVNNLIVRNSYFDHNYSLTYGGAIALGIKCKALIEGNTFIYNKAYGLVNGNDFEFYHGVGGAIASSDENYDSPVIRNNYFYNNFSSNGIVYASNRESQIYNNVICNNVGNAIIDGHQLSKSRIYNNTIANNKVNNGGINIFSSASIYNNIVWNNKSEYSNNQDDIEISSFFSSNPVLLNNCTQKGSGGVSGIQTDPKFNNPSKIIGIDPMASYYDYSLNAETSPCINAGISDTSGFFLPKNDIKNNPRIFGNAIDLGAIESQITLHSIENPNDLEVKIFPNPGSEILNIYSENLKNKVIEIYNVAGHRMLEFFAISNKNSIITDFLTPGIYIIKIISNDSIRMYKWVKT